MKRICTLTVILLLVAAFVRAETFRLQLKGSDKIAGPYECSDGAGVKVGDTAFSMVRADAKSATFSLKHTASGTIFGPFPLKAGAELALGSKTFVVLLDAADQTAAAPSGKPVDVVEKYPSGTVKESYRRGADGKKTGPYLANFENGRPRIAASYASDVLEGAYVEYFEKGRAKLRANYRNGEREGAYLTYTESGKPSVVSSYQGGVLQGKYELYPGDGEKNGVITLLWDKGKISKIGRAPAYPKSIEEIRRTLISIGKPGDAFCDIAKGAPVQNPAVGESDDDAERASALRLLQAYRYLSDVPYNGMKLDNNLNEFCAAGAALCKKLGRLDHTPENPGMPEPEFKKGYKGTSRSNLSMGRATIYGAVNGWMDDSDPSNIAALGHRRWCLCPALMSTGFGRADRFAAMWSFPSGSSKGGSGPIYYPARGYMPKEFFGAQHAWNISIPGESTDLKNIALSVRRVDPVDGLSEPIALDYQNVDKNGYGIPYSLVFRPANLDMTAGKVYFVELRNVGSGDMSFVVEFFDLGKQ